MNRSNQHFGVLFVAAFVILVIMAIAISSFSQMANIVSAGEPPTPVPPFIGEEFTAVIDANLLNQTPINITLADSDWTTFITETFEAALDGNWSYIDNSTTDLGEYKWDREAFSPSPTVGDSLSAWAVAGGLEGQALVANTHQYPDNVDSWLIYGPIDLSGIANSSLTFDYWLETNGGDEFSVSASSTSGTDVATFTGKSTFSTTSGWTRNNYDLSDHHGNDAVYIGFNFTSDAAGDAGTLPGALIDNVQLLVQGGDEIYIPIVRKDPTPTVSPTPSGGTDYHDGFANDITGWENRRSDTQGNHEVKHGDDKKGILSVLVEDAGDYIIVSPLVTAPSTPYSLEINAQHKDPENHDLYGIVFGADWDGNTCPNAEFSSCFGTYYVLKVEYRDNDGTFFRFKLQKVNSFKSNQPDDVDNLIDWTKITSADEGDYNVWRVDVLENNKIKIYLNDSEVGSATDNNMDSFIQPYFGVIVQAKDEHGNARAKFDYFDVIAK
ncbi:MAG: hypothetical protein DWQ04_27780 [Chloroflexi bacterium]|nr:MAG: hypothetical protein DWQ04_27780 [Chloroflexota bacterium]